MNYNITQDRGRFVRRFQVPIQRTPLSAPTCAGTGRNWPGIRRQDPTDPGQPSPLLNEQRQANSARSAPSFMVRRALEVSFPDGSRPPERITATLISEGEAGGFTAMARTVGLPTAIAARLVLEDKLPLTGSQIPTHASIYEPVLRELAEAGLAFTEKTEVIAEQ
jgi:hypothetical protein